MFQLMRELLIDFVRCKRVEGMKIKPKSALDRNILYPCRSTLTSLRLLSIKKKQP